MYFKKPQLPPPFSKIQTLNISFLSIGLSKIVTEKSDVAFEQPLRGQYLIT